MDGWHTLLPFGESLFSSTGPDGVSLGARRSFCSLTLRMLVNPVKGERIASGSDRTNAARSRGSDTRLSTEYTRRRARHGVHGREGWLWNSAQQSEIELPSRLVRVLRRRRFIAIPPGAEGEDAPGAVQVSDQIPLGTVEPSPFGRFAR